MLGSALNAVYEKFFLCAKRYFLSIRNRMQGLYNPLQVLDKVFVHWHFNNDILNLPVMKQCNGVFSIVPDN